MYNFPLRCDGDQILKHIFPSKQKAAQKAIEIARKDHRIERVIVFGSAITFDCGIRSDLDLAIDAPEIKSEDEFVIIASPFLRKIPSEIDIVHLNTIRNDILIDNIKKGVCIYVKQ